MCPDLVHHLPINGSVIACRLPARQCRSSGVYKVRLLLAQLGIPHRRVEVSQLTNDTSRPEFRAINPIGKVPTVVFDEPRRCCCQCRSMTVRDASRQAARDASSV
jgi:hypothetical protein